MSEKDFMKVFSSRLRYYLGANNITQKELANRLGVGTTSVYNWCNGIKVPRMDKVDAMCSVFGCRRADLLMEPDTTTHMELSEDEERLIGYYRQLNSHGQAQAMLRMTELVQLSLYTENPPGRSGTKAV